MRKYFDGFIHKKENKFKLNSTTNLDLTNIDSYDVGLPWIKCIPTMGTYYMYVCMLIRGPPITYWYTFYQREFNLI